MALSAMSLPVAAFAGGAASGTVVNVYLSATYGDLVYVEVSGAKTGNPTCSTGKAPFQFVLPRTSALQMDMFDLLLLAKTARRPVILTGLGSCGVDSTVETLGSVAE